MGQQNSAAADNVTDAVPPARTPETGNKIESVALERLGAILNDSTTLTAETVQELLSFRLPPGTGDDVTTLLKRFNATALLPRTPAAPSCVPSRLMRCIAAAFRACRCTNSVGQQQAKTSLDVSLGLYANLTFLLALLHHFQNEFGSEEVLFVLEHMPTPVNGAAPNSSAAAVEGDASASLSRSPSAGKLPRGCFQLSYMGTEKRIFQVPTRHDCLPVLRSTIISWVETTVPHHLWTVVVGGVLFRDSATGEYIPLREVVRRACSEEGSRRFAMMPLLLSWPERDVSPIIAHSPVLEFVLEAMAFIALTQEQLLEEDQIAHVETMRRVHALVLETLLLLFALVVSNSTSAEWTSRDCTTQDDESLPSSQKEGSTAGSPSQAKPRTFPEFFAGDVRTPVTASFVTGILGLFASVRSEAEVLYSGVDVRHLCKAFIAALVSGLWLDQPHLRSQARHSPSFEGLSAKAVLHTAEVCPTPVDAKSTVQRLSTANAALLAAVIAHPSVPVAMSHLTPHLGGKQPRNPAISVQPADKTDVLVVLNCCPQMLATIVDSRYFPPQPEGTASLTGLVPISFDLLLAAFCSPERLKLRLTSMLLYVLVLRMRAFRLFISSRTDAGLFVMALLRVIAEVSKGLAASITTRNAAPSWIPLPPAVTLLSVVMLVLAKDQQFSTALFQSALPSCPEWLAQGPLRNQLNQKPTSAALAETTVLSAGSAALLVMIKAAAVNLRVSREPFGHTALEATITNLSSGVFNVHWLVAERLLDFTRKVGRQTITKLNAVVRVEEGWAPLPELPFALLAKYAEPSAAETEPGTPDEVPSKAVDATAVILPPELSRSPFSFSPLSPETWADVKCHFHTLRGLLALLSSSARPRPKSEAHNLSVLYAMLRNQQTVQMLRDLLHLCSAWEAARQREVDVEVFWDSWVRQGAEWEAYQEAEAKGNAAARQQCPVAEWAHHKGKKCPPKVQQPRREALANSSGNGEEGHLRHALVTLVVKLKPHVQLLVEVCDALLQSTASNGTEDMNVDDAIAAIADCCEEVAMACDENTEDGKRKQFDNEKMQELAKRVNSVPTARYGYRETVMSCNYFLPLIWKAIHAN